MGSYVTFELASYYAAASFDMLNQYNVIVIINTHKVIGGWLATID